MQKKMSYSQGTKIYLETWTDGKKNGDLGMDKIAMAGRKNFVENWQTALTDGGNKNLAPATYDLRMRKVGKLKITVSAGNKVCFESEITINKYKRPWWQPGE